ncbi:TetR/AcrR family transcriptional regulator [Amycolatopsis echigonensis]|uniref:TetR/AcrR family transcriptional regulator n=1 Tax=Amycolatopsis echigonensis TaxID=2576905 RepID=A0A8E1W5T7_9PSEU|nr:TetR/AcrR family transcriptional regulator [Amycolatopsis echigonensis]MBB2504426.1 TetR/AcrR family transcriptional regulator [Amycolatopsis echigonensis]
MARAKDRTTDRRNREPEIIAAAIELFHRKGYDGASLQDVADMVGVLKGSLYHYISSKEELLARICVESHRQSSEIMEESLAAADNPLDQLRAFLHATAVWYLTNIERVSIYFNEGKRLTGERLEKVHAQGREFHSFIRSLIDKARTEEQVRPEVDPRVAAQLIVGALNSIPTWYRPDGLYSPEEVAGIYTDMTLASLCNPTPPPARKKAS